MDQQQKKEKTKLFIYLLIEVIATSTAQGHIRALRRQKEQLDWAEQNKRAVRKPESNDIFEI